MERWWVGVGPVAVAIFALLALAVTAVSLILRPKPWMFLPPIALSFALCAFMVLTRGTLNFEVFASTYETLPREALELVRSPFVVGPVLGVFLILGVVGRLHPQG